MNSVLFATGGEGGQSFGFLIPLVGMVVIFYFILVRPQQKRQKELQKMIDALKKGDRVMTTGGIFGTVVGIKDDNILVLKIDENTKIELVKNAVASVVKKAE